MLEISITDARGTLSSINLSKLFFVPRRAFWIYGVPEGMGRGGHAHRSCEQLIICLRGTCTISREWLNNTFTTEAKEGDSVPIPTLCWVTLENISADAIIFVLCSRTYDAEDYINDKEELKQCLA